MVIINHRFTDKNAMVQFGINRVVPFNLIAERIFIFTMKAVITVVGKDTVGIIAKVSTVLMENGVNILDISQTTMQDMFTMIMLVDTQKSEADVKTLSERLGVVAQDMGLSIHVQNEELFNSMHRI